LFQETISVEIKALKNEVDRLKELSGKQGKELMDMSLRLAILEAEKSELHCASLTDGSATIGGFIRNFFK